MIQKITNLVKKGNQFIFNCVMIFEPNDPFYNPDNSIICDTYMTDENGRGLFEYNDYSRQYAGLVQFNCSNKSKEAARKYIKRKFGIKNGSCKRK